MSGGAAMSTDDLVDAIDDAIADLSLDDAASALDELATAIRVRRDGVADDLRKRSSS